MLVLACIVFASLRRRAAAEPAGVENNRPVPAPRPPGDLDIDCEQGHGRRDLIGSGGLLRCDWTGAQPPVVSAAVVALDLARCYGAAPAESGKVGLRPLDRFVHACRAIDGEDAAGAGLEQADQ